MKELSLRQFDGGEECSSLGCRRVKEIVEVLSRAVR
jgi:hypothetical protein